MLYQFQEKEPIKDCMFRFRKWFVNMYESQQYVSLFLHYLTLQVIHIIKSYISYFV